MLVSHDYKFIYIKTKKTASTTIERYLQRYCSNGIIQLKKAHRSAESVKKLVGDEVWNTYTKICVIRNPWDKTVSNYFWRSRLKFLNKLLYRILPKYSNYNVLHELSFSEYVHSNQFRNLDEEIILVDGQFPDYQIIRYENLNEDLKKVCNMVGVPFKESKIGSYKSGMRPKFHYRDFYSHSTKVIVEEAYKLEIEKMGYKF